MNLIIIYTIKHDNTIWALKISCVDPAVTLTHQTSMIGFKKVGKSQSGICSYENDIIYAQDL